MRWRVVPRVNKIGNEAAMVSTSPRPIITPASKAHRKNKNDYYNQHRFQKIDKEKY